MSTMPRPNMPNATTPEPPSVGDEMCRAPWATVLSESAGYADSDQCTRVGQIRFGVAVATGLIALSALTRLMLRLGERRPVS